MTEYSTAMGQIVPHTLEGTDTKGVAVIIPMGLLLPVYKDKSGVLTPDAPVVNLIKPLRS